MLAANVPGLGLTGTVWPSARSWSGRRNAQMAKPRWRAWLCDWGRGWTYSTSAQREEKVPQRILTAQSLEGETMEIG